MKYFALFSFFLNFASALSPIDYSCPNPVVCLAVLPIANCLPSETLEITPQSCNQCPTARCVTKPESACIADLVCSTAVVPDCVSNNPCNFGETCIYTPKTCSSCASQKCELRPLNPKPKPEPRSTRPPPGPKALWPISRGRPRVGIPTRSAQWQPGSVT